MNKNFKFIYIFFASRLITASIIEKKASEITDSPMERNNGSGSFFSNLQRKLQLAEYDAPDSLANFEMTPISHPELDFTHNLDLLKQNLAQLRANTKTMVPPHVKNAAINVYIANAELLAKNFVNLNDTKVARKTKDVEPNDSSLTSNIKLTEVVNSKPERMLKQIRKSGEEKLKEKLDSEIHHNSDYFKMAEEGTLFDLDLDKMYHVTQDDLDSFNRTRR